MSEEVWEYFKSHYDIKYAFHSSEEPCQVCRKTMEEERTKVEEKRREEREREKEREREREGEGEREKEERGETIAHLTHFLRRETERGS